MPAISSGSRTRPNRWSRPLAPRPGTAGRPGARRAALLAVDAVVEPELLLQVEGQVLALLVLVADDVVGHVTTQPAHPVHRPVVMTSA